MCYAKPNNRKLTISKKMLDTLAHRCFCQHMKGMALELAIHDYLEHAGLTGHELKYAISKVKQLKEEKWKISPEE